MDHFFLGVTGDEQHSGLGPRLRQGTAELFPAHPGQDDVRHREMNGARMIRGDLEGFLGARGAEHPVSLLPKDFFGEISNE